MSTNDRINIPYCYSDKGFTDLLSFIGDWFETGTDNRLVSIAAENFTENVFTISTFIQRIGVESVVQNNIREFRVVLHLARVGDHDMVWKTRKTFTQRSHLTENEDANHDLAKFLLNVFFHDRLDDMPDGEYSYAKRHGNSNKAFSYQDILTEMEDLMLLPHWEIRLMMDSVRLYAGDQTVSDWIIRGQAPTTDRISGGYYRPTSTSYKD